MISKTAKNLTAIFFDDNDSNLEQELAKIASRENLSAHSIERIVERTNRNIIVGLQKEAVKNDLDPHFTFPAIKTANVIAVLKSKQPSAVPSLPQRVEEKLNLSPLDVPPSRESETRIEDYMGKKPADAGIAMSILSMLKLKLSKKKSKLARIEMALDDMIRKFEKCAANQMLAGTPVEVFNQLPSQDVINGVRGQLEEWGHKIASADFEFDLDFNNEVVKLAYDIEEMRSGIGAAEQEVEEVLEEIRQAKEDAREYLI